jgi:hypothetical protein
VNCFIKTPLASKCVDEQYEFFLLSSLRQRRGNCTTLAMWFADGLRNIHALFQAKMLEKAYEYCVVL